METKIATPDGTYGTLYAHLFENPDTGLARGLFWSFSLPCAPVSWAGDEFDCSVSCEWLQWPITDWTRLDGMTLATSVDPGAAECSVYLADHHDVRLASLAVRRIAGTLRFAVELTGSFDLHGFDELDATDLPLAWRGEVEFTEVLVARSLLPKPADADEARAMLAPFLDVSGLAEPRLGPASYEFCVRDES